MEPIRPLKRSYIVPHNRGSLGILFPAEHRHVGGVMCKNDIPVVRTGHFRVAARSAHNHAITPACRDKISQHGASNQLPVHPRICGEHEKLTPALQTNLAMFPEALREALFQ